MKLPRERDKAKESERDEAFNDRERRERERDKAFVGETETRVERDEASERERGER